MKIPYSWLKEEFGSSTPTVEQISNALIARCFEVEGIESIGDETVIDIKVLPDRAHYALSWNGIAYELAAILGIKRNDRNHALPQATLSAPEVSIDCDPQSVRRYTACRIEGIQNTETPAWLRNRLEAIGQRSINLIVDLANYVMFETGQPLHAFDASKLASEISVRNANNDELFTTLDSKEVKLNSSMVVIADAKNSLALAGIKGGKVAEVTETTTTILLEAANFDPVKTRRTSEKVGIKNDSSKRFENNISPEMTVEGVKAFTSYLAKILHGTKISVGQIYDYYPHKELAESRVISLKQISSLLGREVALDDATRILTSLHCVVEVVQGADIKVTPPVWRRDLVIMPDFTEEIGRLLGYETLPNKLPEYTQPQPINTQYFVLESIKSVLAQQGWTETILYTLSSKGDLETAYPVAKDKAFLRTSLLPNLIESAEVNARNADILEIDTLKQFEIGKVFPITGEKIFVGLACAHIKKVKGQNPQQDIESIIKDIEQSVGITCKPIATKTSGKLYAAEFEMDLTSYRAKDQATLESIPLVSKGTTRYNPFSPFPFSVRDIAVFVPTDITEADIRAVIDQHKGEYCVRLRLFDIFTKTFDDGSSKTSYAFRLVFQSNTATLTEEQISAPVQAIYEALKARGWEIR